MNIEYANTPRWVDESHTAINLTVKFMEVDEELPFTAIPGDCTEHGRELFSRAEAGEFGEVADPA